MNIKLKYTLLTLTVLLALMLSVGIGGVNINPVDTVKIIIGKAISPMSFLLDDVDTINLSILWNIRLPRTFLAFLVGAALAVSGAVMQGILKNPLASSYTLGISSGASFGAALVILVGFSIPFASTLTVPVFGLVFGLLTVFLALGIASGIDKSMETNTIILTGMIISLFINALLTLIMALFKGEMQRLLYWQMGSFALKDWSSVLILAPVLILCTLLFIRYSFEMDIASFGDEQALGLGVDLNFVKWFSLSLSSAMTGFAIAFVGIVGFIDLVAPHIARRLFGPAHKHLLPSSALLGGGLMMLSDLIARTVISPSELPVGAVTALIGAPFFVYIFIKRKKN